MIDILISVIGVLVLIILIYADETRRLDGLLKVRNKELLGVQQRIEVLERERDRREMPTLPRVDWSTNLTPPKGDGR